MGLPRRLRGRGSFVDAILDVHAMRVVGSKEKVLEVQDVVELRDTVRQCVSKTVLLFMLACVTVQNDYGGSFLSVLLPEPEMRDGVATNRRQ